MGKTYHLYELLASFLEYRRASGFATETAGYMINQFLQYCELYYPEAQTITKEMLDNWLVYHQYSNNNQNCFIANLRAFTRYIAFLGIDTFIPDDEYRAKKIQYQPYCFSDDELKRLFIELDSYVGKAINKKYTPEIIVPVVFRLMFCCGLRPQEVRELLIDDVNLETGDIHIRDSKRHKDRHIVMSEDMLKLCRHYNSLAGERTYFFEYKGAKLKKWWVSDSFKRCWKKCGINSAIDPRPYDLRHAFATRNIMKWIDQGIDVSVLLPYLSAYMGHSSITNTLYYVHMLPERLRNSAGIDLSKFSDIYEGGDIDE